MTPDVEQKIIDILWELREERDDLLNARDKERETSRVYETSYLLYLNGRLMSNFNAAAIIINAFPDLNLDEFQDVLEG